MLRLTVCILIAVFLSTVNLNFGPPLTQSLSLLTRITNTPEQALNLNPMLSDDGRMVVFESSAKTLGGGGTSFHTFRTDLSGQAPSFVSIGGTRAVCPALSSDGRIVVFASMEDLVGQNADRNSEIFSFDGLKVRQLTFTTPSLETTRLSDGNFQPSVTSDGQTIVFSSNRNFCEQNTDHSFEIFLYNIASQTFIQLTNDTPERVARSPKISGDGTRVFYKRTAGEDVADLILIETQTLTSRVVAANVEDLSIAEGRAASNDGMRLVYSALTAPNQSQVFVYEGRDEKVRELTQLGSRSIDVKLQPTISGDGKRVAFATRRRVVDTSDGSVELYLFDLPTGEIQQVTDAPSTATTEVVASLNFDGTLAAFNFPRIISGPVSDEDLRNNSEIYLASITPRPEFGKATVLNAASHGREPATETNLAPGSIATIRGNALAFKTEAAAFAGEDPPFTVAGTSVSVNGQPAQIFYAASEEVVFVVPEASSTGPAEIVVTNADGFSSKAVASISHAAPGVFTVAGDGRGEAVILNSETLMAGPFDPSNHPLRLSIFATGVRRANTVTVTIRGRSTIVERVAPAGLSGINEIHVLVPAELSGAGTSTVIVTADGVRSNSTTVVLSGSVPAPSPSPSPSPSPTPTPISTPAPTPTPTVTPTPTPSPIATPSPTPTPTATPTPAPSASPTPTPSPSPVASPRVVISQIFGGGGNSAAPFRNDFIELFNSGNAPVDLTGWSVQYASATALSWSVTPLNSVVLAPGQYYLVQEASGGSNGALVPTPDATGTIAMAAGSGKVALVKNSTALAGTCPNDPNILDIVGYGNTASCFRGSPAPAASNTNAILRAVNGCTNTNNNATDFATGAPKPRNTKAALNLCETTTASVEVFPRKGAKAQRMTSGFRRSKICAFASWRGNFFRGG